ncbi:MAG: hypothetical protein Q7V31_15980 [Parvibaculum sp.]|uniref:hypothetical protein n=1 Tax=Parvibaculum sp. TaxID=2024848 RepID=UPI0027239C8F|nr:hypothetical protein [Parvibaculum sp.]MDO8840412.1 hypothetical protein [Parvibaculum sp.]
MSRLDRFAEAYSGKKIRQDHPFLMGVYVALIFLGGWLAAREEFEPIGWALAAGAVAAAVQWSLNSMKEAWAESAGDKDDRKEPK